MTDEQIKQNAEEYATEHYGEYDEHDYTDHSGSNMCHAVSEKAFIAGVHSRDDEIYDLKHDIEDLQKMVKMRSDAFECARKEIDRLSHPWISVEERLPEHSVNVLVVSNYGDLDEFHVAMLNPYGDFWQTSDCMIIEEGVHSWMPIPRIKKGGEK